MPPLVGVTMADLTLRSKLSSELGRKINSDDHDDQTLDIRYLKDNKVSTVSGRTGDVTLTKDDVGLENVDNTSDATKNIGGNAASATKLQTARTIGGIAFDGTDNINLPGVNEAGDQDTSGNAATATKLQTARTINGVPFDGTKNITLPEGISLANLHATALLF